MYVQQPFLLSLAKAKLHQSSWEGLPRVREAGAQMLPSSHIGLHITQPSTLYIYYYTITVLKQHWYDLKSSGGKMVNKTIPFSFG